jgi:arginine utilization regulatory protein
MSEIMFMSQPLKNKFKKIDDDDETIRFNKLFNIDIKALNNKEVLYSIGKKSYSVKHKRIEDYEMIYFEDFEDLNATENKLFCLEEVIASISEGIILSNREGKIILYNEAQEQLEGLESDKIVGKYLWEAYNYESKEFSEHQKVIKSGEPVKNSYKAHAQKDSVPQYTSYSTYPIERHGKNVGAFSVSKNETILKDLLYETLELKRKLFSHEVTQENEYNKNGTIYTFEDIVGDSESLRDVIEEAKNIAMLENNFLIYGETGTGKEVFAQSVHNLGSNSEEPFVPINCAAIPEGLFEGILFGTVKGSYTGSKDQIGLFEEAGQGTLFLDELNSMPIAMQTKLLRVLQEKRVRRVGGLKTKPIRCRIISAVNETPEKLLAEGRLREDLFYRIAGYSLYIPPLRKRRDDIITMSSYFIKKYNRKLNKRIEDLSIFLKKEMLNYKWPGNVRELEHVIENLMVRSKGEEKLLKVKHLPGHLKSKIVTVGEGPEIEEENLSLTEVLQEVEKQMIIEVLDKNNGNVSQSARDLGIIRQSLIYRMKKLSIEKSDY